MSNTEINYNRQYWTHAVKERYKTLCSKYGHQATTDIPNVEVVGDLEDIKVSIDLLRALAKLDGINLENVV